MRWQKRLSELIENQNNEIILDNEIVDEKVAKKPSYSNEQLELLNAKINDIDLNSSELTEKLDEILNQKISSQINLMMS